MSDDKHPDGTPTFAFNGLEIYGNGVGNLDHSDGVTVINGHVVTPEQWERGWVVVDENGDVR